MLANNKTEISSDIFHEYIYIYMCVCVCVCVCNTIKNILICLEILRRSNESLVPGAVSYLSLLHLTFFYYILLLFSPASCQFLWNISVRFLSKNVTIYCHTLQGLTIQTNCTETMSPRLSVYTLNFFDLFEKNIRKCRVFWVKKYLYLINVYQGWNIYIYIYIYIYRERERERGCYWKCLNPAKIKITQASQFIKHIYENYMKIFGIDEVYFMKSTLVLTTVFRRLCKLLQAFLAVS